MAKQKKTKRDLHDPAKGKWIKFSEDKTYNDKVYVHGKPHFFPIEMVERWVKRGGEIVSDDDIASDKEIQAELDEELAQDLVEEGKISPKEVDSEVTGDGAGESLPSIEDEHEEIEEDEVDHKGKPTGKKKKVKHQKGSR